MYLFVQSFILVWTYGYLLYPLKVSYNTILSIEIVAHMFYPWSLGSLLIGSNIPLTYHHQCVGVFWFWFFLQGEVVLLNTSLLSGTIRCFMLLLYSSCPSSRICHFPKDSWFALRKSDIRNQDLGVKCALWYLSAISFRSSQLTKTICRYTYPCTYTYL